jgi:hypothetical protein
LKRDVLYPLKFMFDVIFLVMTPLTRPASEFHRTRSPTLNPFDIVETSYEINQSFYILSIQHCIEPTR